MKNVASAVKLLFTITTILLIQSSCKKDLRNGSENAEDLNEPGTSSFGHLKQTKTYSSDVVVRWLNMQKDMLQVPMPTGVAAPEANRAIAYCGIALYEAVEPGMPAYQTLSGQLNGLPAIPSTQRALAYHWAASANAALAYMNRHLFPLASAGNKTAIDNLENELETVYASETDAATLQRSIDFGRAVAEIVFNWSQTDGTATLPSPATYIIPVGAGLWEKTPPNFAGPVNPFASQRRLLVNGSTDATDLTPPPTYSTDPSSDFYAMVKDVYDRSQTLTPEQIAAAIYHRDAPGYPGGGTLVPMLAQTFQQSNCRLDAAALAYAKVGLGTYDAIMLGFVKKYQVNLVRPITYIRNVMGHTTWNALFATPGHPEFPSAHAINGGVISIMLTDVFGENFNLTLDHYSILSPPLPSRHYTSFDELGREMGDSRVFGGIHYQASCDKGFWLGKKVSQNILSKVKFLKE
ncbi:MAG: superfamily protein [Chitinophagaceae bacterium]|nr:superfamily protein [Chitinophagaceae bacterium]